MALDAPALTETLIEAGINPSAARRVVDILERDHADLLTEAQLDRRLHEQDRLNQVRFDKIEERLEDVRDQLTTRLDKADERFDKIDDRLDKVEERLTIVERGLAVLTQRVTDLENNINQRFDDMNKRFLLLLSGMGISLATILAVLGWIISRLP